MGGPGLFGRLANVRLLVAAREVRNVEEPAATDVREVQWSREASIVAVDVDRHVDAVAGSEFVDDRIRLRE